MPPLSWIWKPKLVYGLPLALAAGRKTSLPAPRSAALTVLGRIGGASGRPRERRLALAGRLVTMTAARLLAGLSLASVKLKSVPANTLSVSSLVVTELSTATGASLTERTLTVRVAVLALVSAPP